MASWEEKFNSAVEIIRTLPKEGNVNPTNSMKLKFYSYFKQATEGPCDAPKPGFWEVVNRAKWDAWNKLGKMSKEEAMRRYVEEFLKILQEHSLDDLDDISVLNDYVDLMEPYIEYAPKEVRELYKQRQGKNNNIDVKEIYENHLAGSGKPIKIELPKTPALNGHASNCNNNDSDSDEFSDTLERVDEGEEAPTSGVVSERGGGEPRITKGNAPPVGSSGPSREPQPSHSHRESDHPVPFPPEHYRSGGGGEGSGGGRRRNDSASEEEPGLATAVIRLQHVLEQVVERLDSLEALLSEQRNRNRSWFPTTPRVAVVLLLAWPLVLQWAVFLMRRRRRLHQ